MKQLESISLKPPVERAAAQAERLGGLTDVAVETRHAFLIRKHSTSSRLWPRVGRHLRGSFEAEVARLLDERSLRHQYGALDRVIDLADVAGPRVLEEDLHRAAFEAGQPLAIALRVLPQEVLGE